MISADFLKEIIVGESVFVDPVKWDLATDDTARLSPGEPIALGFDGSKFRAAAALVASRLSDGHLFTLRVWERAETSPARTGGCRRWKSIASSDVEQHMDKAIERFTTAFGRGEITHDGSGVLARHMKNAVLVKGRGGRSALARKRR